MINLSPECTQLLLERVSSRNSKWGACFLLIEQSGALRKGGPAVVADWVEAATIALAEGLVVYNTRSHHMVYVTPAQTRRARAHNVTTFTLNPACVKLHGPTLHRHPIPADREIIYGGTYSWEDKA